MGIVIRGGRTVVGLNVNGQSWSLTNLDVTTFSNGDPIPQVTNGTTWGNTTSPAWCYYNNDPALGAIYGKIYNGHAIRDPRGLAPYGYRIATTDDWLNVSNIVTPQGLRQTGIVTWSAGGGTNESKLNVLGGGYRYFSGGGFYNINATVGYYTGKIEFNVASMIIIYSAAIVDWQTSLTNNSGGYVRLIKL